MQHPSSSSTKVPMGEPHEKIVIFENENEDQTLATIDHSEIIDYQLKAMGLKISRLEDYIKRQKLHKKRLEEEILGLEAELRSHTNSNDNLSNHEEQTLEQRITNLHGNSPAGILLQFQAKHDTSVLQELFPGTIIGVFCTLWKAKNPNLNSVLSEFLGTETNLAIICACRQPMESLERGFQYLASSLERIMDDRVPVIFMEDLSGYKGGLVYDDPERRLDLAAPTLSNGRKPRGFMGFAVNMVDVKREMVFDVGGCGCGLRETLLYSFFSHLQVYKTREFMMDALPCIAQTAVSLDGAIVFNTRAISPSIWGDLNGGDSTHVGVAVSESSTCDAELSVEKQIEDKNRLVTFLLSDIKRQRESLRKEIMRFQGKKQTLSSLSAIKN